MVLKAEMDFNEILKKTSKDIVLEMILYYFSKAITHAAAPLCLLAVLWESLAEFCKKFYISFQRFL